MADDLRTLTWDGDEWRRARNAKLSAWINNPQAEAFFLELSHFVEVFDDFVDGDRSVSKEDAAKAVLAALYTIPTNPFFRQHQAQLLPYMFSSTIAWLDSNELCKGDESDKALAYTLKGMGIDVLLAVIAITRGVEYMRGVSVEVRRVFMAHEPFADYCKEQGNG